MTSNRSYRAAAEHTGLAFSPTGCAPIGNMINPNLSGTAPPPGTSFAIGPAQPLTNLRVSLIFWGAWWDKNPQTALVEAAIANLLAGPYMSYLAQYGVQRATVRGAIFVVDSEPGTFTFSGVGNLVTYLLDEDQLPEPDDNWPNVYAVIMPQNSAYAGTFPPDVLTAQGTLPPGAVSQVNGQNGYITWNDYDPGDVDNDPAFYLWVGNDGTVDFVTTVFSHELAEIATDPKGAGGVRQIGCTGGSCQIGDVLTVCQGWCDDVRGVKAQAYWSQLDGNGVLPVKYSVRRTMVNKSLGGRIPRPTPSLNRWISSEF